MFLEENRGRIEKDFAIFCRELPQAAGEIREKLGGVDENTALALKYLYGNMPISDAGNYPFEIFLDFARHGVRLWETSPYRKNMPEDLFLNYVLYHRVNEEEIRPCRGFFHEKLQGLVQGLSMEQAALEVNYWCAGEATYQATDGRTRSAIGVYERGFGRCGEESVFAVNVLRSVGIPARQVYAMRWSHCDDNHAWVEVWCDGTWHYLGACEPEAVLDKGWFTNAASRAMMIGSRWFDRKEPDEEVLGQEGMNRMLNQLGRYADTKKLRVLVKDADGCPIKGADVYGEVMNYSEFFPVITARTGEDGRASFVTGLGSLHLRASFQGRMGECLTDTRETDQAVCVLGEEILPDRWRDFDMIAPADRGERAGEGMRRPAVSEEENSRRTEEAAARCRRKRESFQPLWKKDHLGLGKETAEKLMSVLSDKDRMDAQPDILLEHWKDAAVYREAYPEELFLSYVWNPRVEDEILTGWRKGILGYFDKGQQEEFREAPVRIWKWIRENIVSRDDRERLSIVTTPLAALKLGIASQRSQRVLFVAIARTLGIPARRSPEDGEAEYWDGKAFCPVKEEKEKTARLVISGEEEVSWKYFQNWSIARREGTAYHTLRLRDFSVGEAEDPGREQKGASPEKSAERSGILPVEPGCYRVLTANRLPTGNLFAKRYDLKVAAGETHYLCLKLREASLGDMLDSHYIPDYFVKDETGTEVSLGSITAGRRKILFWLETDREPTEHILNEILEHGTDFLSCQDQLVFFLNGPEAEKNLTFQKCRELLPGAKVFFDTFGRATETVARRMYADPDKLPLLVVTEGELNGIFAAAGYSVGMADLLLRVLKS